VFVSMLTRNRSECRIASGRHLSTRNIEMSKSEIFSVRITANQKALIGSSVFRRRGIAESAFLGHVIETAVETAGDVPLAVFQQADRTPHSCRVSVRLHPEDRLLVREGARREFPSMSGYAESIVRRHVQARLQLPALELDALRVSIAEVNEIGRMNLPNTSDLKSLLTALSRMRDRFRALMLANASSWGQSTPAAKRCSPWNGSDPWV
jgi:hypothetical protein